MVLIQGLVQQGLFPGVGPRANKPPAKPPAKPPVQNRPKPPKMMKKPVAKPPKPARPPKMTKPPAAKPPRPNRPPKMNKKPVAQPPNSPINTNPPDTSQQSKEAALKELQQQFNQAISGNNPFRDGSASQQTFQLDQQGLQRLVQIWAAGRR